MPSATPELHGSRLTRRRFLGASVGFGAACLLGVTADAALIEPRRPIIERTEIRLARLPREFDGLTIAHLSDFHHDSQSSAELIRDAVRTTNELKPDIVVLTGDYVTLSAFGGRTSAAHHANPCAQILSDLRALLASLACSEITIRKLERTRERWKCTGSPFCVTTICTLSAQEHASGLPELMMCSEAARISTRCCEEFLLRTARSCWPMSPTTQMLRHIIVSICSSPVTRMAGR